MLSLSDLSNDELTALHEEQARAYDDEFKEIGVFGRKRGAHCDGV